MTDEQAPSLSGGLSLEYQHYERQRCFIGHSLDAPWREDLVTMCSEVLPDFGLEPWYAADHFTPTKSLREKVVELIANTRYGIYDLSSWRKDDKSEWHLPRNVYIELGIAIALNRPMLLLRHSSNRVCNLVLPRCLESISEQILEFSGAASLRRLLKEQLSQWTRTLPEQDWWNRYCTFGNRTCEYRETHPHMQQWGQQKVRCHISDGEDPDRFDFREVVEEVVSRFEDVDFEYLDALSPRKGYSFLLCSHCQTVRSTPFAIYRITEQTPPETFIAIGMSLALETQFSHTIPKILLTTTLHDIPSLLTGYEVVVAHNDYERKTYLRKFMPQVIQLTRKANWKPRPLPFIEIVPRPVEKPSDDEEEEAEQGSEVSIDTIGKYGVIREIGRGSFAVVYLVRNTESKHIYAMKVLHPELTGDGEILARFQREARILLNIHDPHIVEFIDDGMRNDKHYMVMEYVEGHNLKYHLRNTGPMDPLRAFSYIRQVAEGLDTAYQQGVVHRNLKPQTILINNEDEIKISGFSLARRGDSAVLTQSNTFMGTAYYIAPEQAEDGRLADTRSDLYSLAAILFEMLIGRPPFVAKTAVDIVLKHMNERVPSIRHTYPELPSEIDVFLQKALAKAPEDRYQTPREFITALDELSEKIKTMPKPPASSNDLDGLIGKTLSHFRIVERLGAGSMATVFKAYQPVLDRSVAIKVLPAYHARDPLFVTRFEQEARSVAKLAHPNIVQIHDFGEQDTITYIVMEYVDGGTLKDRLKGALSVREATDFILQAAEGLDCAHRNDIIHRDVKPSNMLLRKDGHLLLADFGIAKMLEGTTNLTSESIGVMGTPYYMSPEQGMGQVVDRRSDIYSLGIVFFHCLTGRVPFTGDSPITVTVQHLQDPLPVERLTEQSVPESLIQVILKMTAKQPQERYQTMLEVISALERKSEQI